MKNTLIFFILLILLSSCGKVKRYDVKVQYFNESIDTIVIFSEKDPILTPDGGVMSCSDAVFSHDKVEVAGVRKIRIVKVKEL